MYALKVVSHLLQATASILLQSSNSLNVCLFTMFVCHLSPVTNFFSHTRHTQLVRIGFTQFLRQGQITIKVAIDNKFKAL